MTACTRCGERYYREGLCRACRYYVAGDELAAAADTVLRELARTDRCQDMAVGDVEEGRLRNAIAGWRDAVQPGDASGG